MTVQQLIDALQKIENKSQEVYVSVGEEITNYFCVESEYDDGIVYIKGE